MSDEIDETELAEGRINGLYCFIDSARACGADCMAFLPAPAEDKSQSLSPQQYNCTVIVSVERIGRFMSGLVQLGLRRHQETSTRAKDEARVRATSAPIPNPRGG